MQKEAKLSLKYQWSSFNKKTNSQISTRQCVFDLPLYYVGIVSATLYHTSIEVYHGLIKV